MNLKNYTSSVAPTISMARIEQKLIDVGATSISKQYDGGICRGISFVIFDKRSQQSIAFHLKAQVDECFKVFWNERARQHEKYKQQVLDQANKTAWKILSDWVEIQCTMILLKQAEPLQMFLPFVYDMKNNETLYDKVIAGKMPLLLNQ